MERFIKFKDDIDLRIVSENLNDDRIIVLRKSQTTNTIQIKILDNLTNKQIKHAFSPLVILKIHKEFPYPLKGDKFFGLSKISLKNLFA
ncbi:hypothetical protein GF337_08635 [candidate division KSB1 bacterium]|nr:hypothetical protein [candidate division KSB1 bacterium]